MTAAWLQRLMLLSLVSAATTATALTWRPAGPAYAVLAGAAILAVPAWVLALEFPLMMWVNRREATPGPTAGELIRAWWAETRAVYVAFAWRQPFCADTELDHLPLGVKHRRGVLLVHGFLCNRGLWNPWMRRLRQSGVPFVAVTLDPVFGSIEDYGPTINASIDRLEEATGLAPVVVAHSMGGLALRRWLVDRAPSRRPRRILTLGTPHHGTWLARVAVSLNARQMRLDGLWLKNLRLRESGYSDFICFYSDCDNIVFPAGAATLEGAENHRLRGVPHLRMIDDPIPFQLLLQHLE